MGVQKGIQKGSKRGSIRGSRLRGSGFVSTPFTMQYLHSHIVILIIYLQCNTYITFIKILTWKNSPALHYITHIMIF